MSLLIGELERKRIAELIAFAHQKANWLDMEGTPFVPGDNPFYVLQLGNFRCVYTCTKANKDLFFRNLSVSVARPDRYPKAVPLFTVAALFGFTNGTLKDGLCVSPGPDWQILKCDNSIVIAELMSKPE